MKSVLLCVAWIVLMAEPAAADVHARLNIRVDISEAPVAAFGSTREIIWNGWEAELEAEWDDRKLFLSGVAFGVRKEGQYYTDGTFLTGRLFGRIQPKSRRLGIYPSLGLVYGMPGPPMMRVGNDGAWTFPVRTVDIPGTEVGGDGILYPELSAALRLRLRRFTAEPVIGIRWIRFGTQWNGQYSDGRVLTPTLGLRVGFTLASAR